MNAFIFFLVMLATFFIMLMIMTIQKRKKLKRYMIKMNIDKKRLKEIEKEVLLIFSKYSDRLFDANGKRLTIRFELSGDIINGNAAIPGVIRIMGNWYKIYFKDDIADAIVLTTLVHENAHKLNEPIGRLEISTEDKFVNDFREIRADIYGKEIIRNIIGKEVYEQRREEFVEAMKYKAKQENEELSTKRFNMHPSSKFRIEMYEKHEHLSDELIEDIAQHHKISTEASIVKKMKEKSKKYYKC